MEFGRISREHWYQPDSVDEEKAEAGRNRLVQEGVIYGGSVSYRLDCFITGLEPSADTPKKYVPL